MFSPYAIAALFGILLLMTRYQVIADAYDLEQRKADWDHCRYGGTFRKVLAWWWCRWLRRL